MGEGRDEVRQLIELSPGGQGEFKMGQPVLGNPWFWIMHYFRAGRKVVAGSDILALHLPESVPKHVSLAFQVGIHFVCFLISLHDMCAPGVLLNEGRSLANCPPMRGGVWLLTSLCPMLISKNVLAVSRQRYLDYSFRASMIPWTEWFIWMWET